MSTYYRVFPALNENDPTPQWRGCVEAYAVDVNTSRTPEESPSWPNGIMIILRVRKSAAPLAHQGRIQGTFRERSGNIQRIFSGLGF
jgi:hypothetical protein